MHVSTNVLSHSLLSIGFDLVVCMNVTDIMLSMDILKVPKYMPAYLFYNVTLSINILKRKDNSSLSWMWSDVTCLYLVLVQLAIFFGVNWCRLPIELTKLSNAVRPFSPSSKVFIKFLMHFFVVFWSMSNLLKFIRYYYRACIIPVVAQKGVF